MSKPGCEEVQMAAMAMEEHEVPLIPEPLVHAHLSECAACREAVAAMSAAASRLESQSRRRHAANLWPAIQPRVEQRQSAVWPYVALTVLLTIFELVVLVPDRQWSMAIGIIPLLIAAGTFRILRESPFQIATELRLEGVHHE